MKSRINDVIEAKKEKLTALSDAIWDVPETAFTEFQSVKLLCDRLKSEGFEVEEGVGGVQTAFTGKFGSGKPVIGILGEFVALSGLSQVSGLPEKQAAVKGGNGHGCGHHLLGTGSLAAVDALKTYMEQNNLSGTIRYYGCPAEENAGGKAYLVRDGYFDDCDVALTWHPFAINKAMKGGYHLANFRAFFTFHGISSHAAGAPELGRSALDAVEVMDIGVNFMREHMIDAARVHGAITNSGGIAPNVIPSEAQILYAIRAPKVTQVKQLFDRMCDIAKGAALITGTTVDIKQVAAYSDVVNNDTLNEMIEENLKAIVPIGYTEEELEYARKFQEVTTVLDKEGLKSMAGELGKKDQLPNPIWDFIVEKNTGISFILPM